MAEKLDPRQLMTFEELLRAMMFESEAVWRVLVKKGLLSSEEVLVRASGGPGNEGRETAPQKIGSTGGRTARHADLC